MKKAIILLIIATFISLSYLFPHTMLNPGKLMEGHQRLNSKCMSCHTAFSGISNDKCISCHKLSEIGKDTLHVFDSTSNKMKSLFHQQLSAQTCSSCHTDHKGLKPAMSINGFKHEMISQNILTNCNSCHQKPKDSYHQLLTTGCNKCHSTTKWLPSTFDHSKYFQLNKHHNVSCNTCHTNNDFTIYTCYSCHEHSESKIISKHNEEGIYNITKCASCHKSGNEHDIINGNESNQKDRNNVNDYIKQQGKEKKNEKDDD
jgi:hypothetical protein